MDGRCSKRSVSSWHYMYELGALERSYTSYDSLTDIPILSITNRRSIG